MGDKSKIEWTDATWNPVTGCSAENVKLHPSRLDQPIHWKRPRRIFVSSMSDLFHERVPFEFIDSVFAVMAMAQNHTFQVLTKRPLRMLEYFGRLTPERMAYVGASLCGQLGWPVGVAAEVFESFKKRKNVWLGVSVEDQPTADERIPFLLQTPAAVRWVCAGAIAGASASCALHSCL